MNTLERTKPNTTKQSGAASGTIRAVSGVKIEDPNEIPSPGTNPAGFFEQMIAAVEAYPETYVILEIVDVSIPGDVLNVGETGFFRVRVTNNGPLHLTGVTLRVSGQNGATVRAGLPTSFVSDFISAELPTIDAHGGSQELSLPSFKAPAGAQDSKTLVKATLEDWNVDLNHPLIGHSDPHRDAPKGTYAAAVRPL